MGPGRGSPDSGESRLRILKGPVSLQLRVKHFRFDYRTIMKRTEKSLHVSLDERLLVSILTVNKFLKELLCGGRRKIY